MVLWVLVLVAFLVARLCTNVVEFWYDSVNDKFCVNDGLLNTSLRFGYKIKINEGSWGFL